MAGRVRGGAGRAGAGAARLVLLLAVHGLAQRDDRRRDHLLLHALEHARPARLGVGHRRVGEQALQRGEGDPVAKDLLLDTGDVKLNDPDKLKVL